jgi:ketosteroid isomerase-like protein
MSRENVQLVRRVYEAIARGDSDSVLAAYDPEIELDFSRTEGVTVLTQGIYIGHEGLRTADREWHEVWVSLDFECDELIDAGEQVVAVVTVRGRGRESGAEAEMVLYGVWTIDNGKIVRVEWHPTREQALEAAGLLP